MPISISYFIRSTPTDNTFGAPPPPGPPTSDGVASTITPVFLTQRGYRFEGYHLHHDRDENVVLTMPASAWLNQPQVWFRRSITTGTFDLRAP